MKNAIETFELTKKYKKFTAVNSLNFNIPNKTIFGMLGPNGAGKTTTIKMLTCLAQPTSGTAKVAGYDIKENPNEVREKIGMVPQAVSLYKDLTVKENAEMCSDYYGLNEDEKFERIDELMELVDIKYAENKLIKHLSGGQKQKASLVASLVHRPDILFLDEPTIGLDPTTKRVLWNIIQDLNDEGHTIILCSHDMHEVDMLCDNVGIINTGNLVAYDTPHGLKDTLLKQQKEEYENLTQTLTKVQKETKDLKSPRNFYHRDVSLLIENLNDTILNYFKNNQKIHETVVEKNGRVNLKVDTFDENIVNDIIKVVQNYNGKISSIYTEEPSLEDVFMNVTADVDEDARA